MIQLFPHGINNDVLTKKLLSHSYALVHVSLIFVFKANLGPLSVGTYWYKAGVEGRTKRPVSSVSIGRGKMGLWNLFEVASMPILQVLIISMLGAFMATDHLKLLPPDARKYMNKVGCFFFFEGRNRVFIFLCLVVVSWFLSVSEQCRLCLWPSLRPSCLRASQRLSTSKRSSRGTMLLVSYEEKHAYLIICFWFSDEGGSCQLTSG